MAKQKKEAVKAKSLKEQKKELESKLFGEKNNSKKKELQGMIKKIEIAMKLESNLRIKKEEEKKENLRVKQVIPMGVDPKNVQCANFMNGICDKGEMCQFSHTINKMEKKLETEVEENKPRKICRFILDAINANENLSNWKCPFPGCRDIHKLVEIGDDKEIEITLDEFIELQRQNLDEENKDYVTEESFKAWKAKKEKDEDMHKKRVSALSNNAKGIELFKICPEIFEDDDDVAEDIDYTNRNYEDSEEKEENK